MSKSTARQNQFNFLAYEPADPTLEKTKKIMIQSFGLFAFL